MAIGRSDLAPDIARALELPRIVRLESNLYGLAFSLMKLIPARHILERARKDGRLDSGAVVVESTSGTFGLALAMHCSLLGQPLVLVSDPAVDSSLRRRIEDLGARVEIVEQPSPIGGFQQARLLRLAQVCERHPRHFLPSQYDNPDHPSSYEGLATFLHQALGEIDYLVGPVGSGGSMCGTATALRQKMPHLAAVGVDTPGSVLFGQPDGPRALRGLGNSIMPANLDHRVFDEVHWVGAPEAFLATRLLHRRHALFMGPTSGAAWLAARSLARRNRAATVAMVLPDEGHRYLATVYDDVWLAANQQLVGRLPSRPIEVSRPSEAGDRWSYLTWGRRSRTEVQLGIRLDAPSPPRSSGTASAKTASLAGAPS
ncbi:MAG: cysteine synthase family protein [Acidimicrobiia bacterium]